MEWCQIARSRWLMLVAGIWIQITTGSSYVFGLYSESLKRALGFDQTQLDTVAFFKGIGANVGIHTGLLYLVLPPWVILALGAAHDFLGYFMLWLAGTHRIRHVQMWQLCVFMLVAANSQTYFSTAVVVTSVTNFPSSRGTVIGLMKGCLGLSGAILTFFYRSLRMDDGANENEISYTLFAAIVPSLVCALLMFFIRPVSRLGTHDPCENSSMSRISTIVVALAFGLIPLSLLPQVSQATRIVLCVLLLLALGSPLVVAFSASNRNDLLPEENRHSLLEETSNANTVNFGEDKVIERQQRSRLVGHDYTLVEAAMSLEFWLLVVAMACGMGSGLTTIDNMNQLGISLGFSARSIAVVVSLYSIWNFLGRFGAGAISDILLRTRGIPRPVVNSVSLGAMAVGHLIIAAAFPGALYVGTLIVGLGYGSQWSLMPATVSEIFGMRQFGTLFNTIAVASPLGSYVLSVKVAGYFYDREARKQQNGLFASSSTLCIGASCFRQTFMILAGVCLLGSACTSLLALRTRKFYREVFETSYARQ